MEAGTIVNTYAEPGGIDRQVKKAEVQAAKRLR
jgi:hypothetical protein